MYALLFWLLMSTIVRGQGNVAEEWCWRTVESLSDKGLDPESFKNGASYVGRLLNVIGDACKKACCQAENCHLVLEGNSGNGVMECSLVNCLKDGENKCRLMNVPGSKMHRKGEAELKAAFDGTEAATTVGSVLPTMTSADFEGKCLVPPETGMCRAYMPRYFFNNSAKACQLFIYGGCGGNQNNYGSMEKCKATCSVNQISSPWMVAEQHSLEQEAAGSNACTAPYEVGPCRAAHRMFYFDPKTGSCLPFIYGGCHGNDNRYGTVEECMSRCTGQGKFDLHGHNGRPRPAFFLVATLAVMTALLLVAFVVLSVRRVRSRQHRADDKEELLPEEQLPVVEKPSAVST